VEDVDEVDKLVVKRDIKAEAESVAMFCRKEEGCVVCGS
jgi:hypothetical protein